MPACCAPSGFLGRGYMDSFARDSEFGVVYRWHLLELEFWGWRRQLTALIARVKIRACFGGWTDLYACVFGPMA